MQPFKLKAEYNPAGDQPQAIEELVKGLDKQSEFANAFGRHRVRQNIHHC